METAAVASGNTLASLKIGDHLVTPRRFYTHHGIYIGGGQVVHYAGFLHWKWAGPVEQVSIEEFTQGRTLSVIDEPRARFQAAEIVRRAVSRVGEDRYRLLTNNCEHFCAWCFHGASRSAQVDRWLSAPRRWLSC